MPIPVPDQFTKRQKDEIVELWKSGSTQSELAVKYGVPRRTMMKLCNYLGLKRTTKEVAKVCDFKSKYDTPENVAMLRELRETHNLSQLAANIGCSISAVHRLCAKYDIVIDKDIYANTQSERMKLAWTNEKKAVLSGSIYDKLNDKEWLFDHYITKGMSASQLSTIIEAPFSTVIHHLKRHDIKLRTKNQYLSKLRRLSTSKRVVSTRWGELIVQSIAEQKFLESLPDSVRLVTSEPYTIEYLGMQYVPDFEVDGELIEVKPPQYATKAGVDRQRIVKQKLIANHNGKDFKCWYHRGGGYYEIDPIEDIDKYFCLNWKLAFKSVDECYGFIVDFGFQPLRWNKDKLLLALNSLFKAKGDNRLNANYTNVNVVNLIIHFSDHYWWSTHKNYNPIAQAFLPGNRTILRDAIYDLWYNKKEVNIYSLVRLIARKYKDFTPVSVFKPWVARYVYETILPNGGRIIDPCMGWGGRLLGTLDSNYSYVGYDFNPCVVSSHKALKKFVGSRFTNEVEFHHADSSQTEWPDGDLLFTSPPYDDTEYYHGLSEQCLDTSAIYENIMRFKGLVALNVPLRHQEKCMKIAISHGRKVISELKMKTANFMGRETTYEPILVFAK